MELEAEKRKYARFENAYKQYQESKSSGNRKSTGSGMMTIIAIASTVLGILYYENAIPDDEKDAWKQERIERFIKIKKLFERENKEDKFDTDPEVREYLENKDK